MQGFPDGYSHCFLCMKLFDMDGQSRLGIKPAAALWTFAVCLLMRLLMLRQVRVEVERVRALVAPES